MSKPNLIGEKLKTVVVDHKTKRLRLVFESGAIQVNAKEMIVQSFTDAGLTVDLMEGNIREYPEGSIEDRPLP